MGTEHTAETLRWGVNLGKNSAFKPPQLPKKWGPKLENAKKVKISTGKPPVVKFKPINESIAGTLKIANITTPNFNQLAQKEGESLVTNVLDDMTKLIDRSSTVHPTPTIFDQLNVLVFYRIYCLF